MKQCAVATYADYELSVICQLFKNSQARLHQLASQNFFNFLGHFCNVCVNVYLLVFHFLNCLRKFHLRVILVILQQFFKLVNQVFESFHSHSDWLRTGHIHPGNF